MRFFAAALIFFGAASFGQTPEVPHKLMFAGMTLTIHDDARREIQKDVDALTRSPRYFNMKVDRARAYFPIIEKIFREEHLPDDFKYLALQESALVSDAVSSSNAVGFWQFKDFTAQEVGMRVDRDIDERMNVVSSTRGAARYIKKNNYYFNNWLYALQAYQMGAGGVMREVGTKHNGARHMDITSRTYWYVKKYLAHKIAFEGALAGDPSLKLSVVEVSDKKSLKALAEELDVKEDLLAEYNKWILRGSIPNDKPYAVLLPSGTYNADFTMLGTPAVTAVASSPRPQQEEVILINGVPTIKARPGERITALADRAGIRLGAFLKYNDLSIDRAIHADSLYFIEAKRGRAAEAFHKVQPGEDLWTISQHYGVKLRRLKKYNRLPAQSPIHENDVLWLSYTKPKARPGSADDVLQLDQDKEFDWSRTTASIASSPVSSESPRVAEKASSFVTTEVPENQNVDDNLAAGAEQTTFHEVKPSDTLYSVARQYGVTIQDLMNWNEKNDFSLSVGEKLKIHQK